MDKETLKVIQQQVSEALGDDAVLGKFQDKLLEEIDNKDRQKIVSALVSEVTKAAEGKLNELADEIKKQNVKQQQSMIDGFKQAIKEAWTVKPVINIPKPEVTVSIPAIKIPEIKAPNVTVQPAEVIMPDFPKEIEVAGMGGWFQKVIDALTELVQPAALSEYHRGNPVLVQLIDLDGNPYKARGGGSIGVSSGGSDSPAGNPVGYQQMTVTSSALPLSNIPLGAIRALVTVESDVVRWRDDGSAPTASTGIPMVSGQSFELPSSGSIANFQVIKDASATTTPLLNINFYKR